MASFYPIYVHADVDSTGCSALHYIPLSQLFSEYNISKNLLAGENPGRDLLTCNSLNLLNYSLGRWTKVIIIIIIIIIIISSPSVPLVFLPRILPPTTMVLFILLNSLSHSLSSTAPPRRRAGFSGRSHMYRCWTKQIKHCYHSNKSFLSLIIWIWACLCNEIDSLHLSSQYYDFLGCTGEVQGSSP